MSDSAGRSPPLRGQRGRGAPGGRVAFGSEEARAVRERGEGRRPPRRANGLPVVVRRLVRTPKVVHDESECIPVGESFGSSLFNRAGALGRSGAVAASGDQNELSADVAGLADAVGLGGAVERECLNLDH